MPHRENAPMQLTSDEIEKMAEEKRRAEERYEEMRVMVEAVHGEREKPPSRFDIMKASGAKVTQGFGDD